MLIHMTGMSPRTASQRTRERVTFAGLLERVLISQGHEVIRSPYLDSLTKPDLTMVGLASMISPGATYALAGLEAIGRAVGYGTPLLLFVDDPVLPKIKAGAKSVLREEGRLWSSYLHGKRIAESRDPTPVQRWHIRGAIELLGGEHWPTVLVPMHSWGVMDELMAVLVPKRLGIVSDVIALDVSAVLELDLADSAAEQPRAHIWVDDSHYSSQRLDPARVHWPVVPINSTGMDSPQTVYAAARGVFQGLVGGCPGWWTPTPLYAAHAGAAYLMDQAEQNLTGSLSPYYLTADDIEMMNDGVHEMLIEKQRRYLRETTWSLDDLSSRLTDVLGSANSFMMPGTTTSPTSPTS